MTRITRRQFFEESMIATAVAAAASNGPRAQAQETKRTAGLAAIDLVEVAEGLAVVGDQRQVDGQPLSVSCAAPWAGARRGPR